MLGTVRARRIALPHERQIWSDLMRSRSINHNGAFAIGPPDVQRRTQIRSRAMRREGSRLNIAKPPELFFAWKAE